MHSIPSFYSGEFIEFGFQEIDHLKRRNDIIIKEADDRHTSQEKQHEAKIHGMEQKQLENLKSVQEQLDKDR